MLLIAAALAETIYVPLDQTTVAEAVAYAAGTTGADEIVISATYVPSTKAVDVGDQTLTFSGDGATCGLEPLFGQGANLTIRDASFTEVGDWAGSPFALTSPCALCVRLGEVLLERVEFQSAAGYGIIVVDTDLTATGLTMGDGRDGHALASVALTHANELSVTSSTFYQNFGGAVKLYGDYGYEVAANFEDVDFFGNVGSEGSTFYARNATLSVAGGTQSENIARGTSPIDLENVTATFDGVSFDGNSGVDGNLLSAYVTDEIVTFSGGSVQNGKGSFGDVMVTGGGRLSFVDVDWTPQGVLQINASALSISGGTWTVGGDSPGIIYGVDADITWRGSTICGEGSDAPNFKGILRGYGGKLRFEKNVVQSVVSDSEGLIRGGGFTGEGNGPTIEVYDNTILGTRTTSLIDGEAVFLAFVNNIVMTSIGAFDIGEWPATSQGEFNLFYDATSEATGSPFPSGWGENDLVGVDPMFLSMFNAAICGEDPLLRTGSPAIDAGSPDRTDDYGVGTSDIGAFDGGNGEDVLDTGSPADTGDSGGVANDQDGDGTPDAIDCEPGNRAINPRATEIANDGVDQNCDGTDATLSYGGGCQGLALQLTGLSLLLFSPLRRRR